MRSSISSFKLSLIFLAVFAVLGGAGKMLLLGQLPEASLPVPDSFWAEKTSTTEKFDIVIVGDSRVYRGVSPEGMRQVLPKARILNFGYSSGGLDAVLLSAAVDKLDLNGSRVLLLGVSPHALTESACLNEHYRETQKISFTPRLHTLGLEKAILWMGRLFSPEESLTALGIAFGQNKLEQAYLQIPHKGGWLESSYLRDAPESALEDYGKIFAKYQVSPGVQDKLLDLVRALHAHGVKVVAFRPPSTRAMEKLEDQLACFDEAAFKAKFGQAGGVWLEIADRYGFASYDGSHLRGDAALRLSGQLANNLAEYLY